MDFLDPKRKKTHKIRLFLGYFLVAVAVAFGTLILLFQSYGYDLDRKTGKLIQNGLMFVSSTPDNVNVYLNGELNKSQTDTKLTIPAGQYIVELKKDGYRDWKRSISLEGGSVERLTYPLMIPAELKLSDVQLYSTAPFFATQSPDRRWLMIWPTASLLSIDMFDTNAIDQEPVPLTLPADLFNGTGANHTLSLLEWSKDNRHLLLRHIYDGGSEFVMIDRESPEFSVNLTRRLGNAVDVISLRDKEYDQLYIHEKTSQRLSVYDINSQAIRGVLQDVIDYRTRGADMILYTSADKSAVAPTTAIKLWDGANNYTLRTFPTEDKFIFDLTRNDDGWLVAIGPGSGKHIYIYKNPIDQLKSKTKLAVPLSVLKIDQAKSLLFSSSGAYLLAQNGPELAVYDYEADRRFYYDLKLLFSDSLPASWIDEDRLTVNSDNRSYIFDFDGSNLQPLTPTVANFTPYYNRDYSSQYNVGPSVVVPGRFALTATSLRAD
jgi:PEGA domain